MTSSIAGKRLLIVDDDLKLLEFLDDYFSAKGFSVEAVNSGLRMSHSLAKQQFDLVILDIGLPDGNGIDLARELRRTSNIPIVMLTGQGDAIDRVVGLEVGADDYVSKPFSNRELLARVNAVLRRAASQDETEEETDCHAFCMFEGWNLDLTRKKLVANGGEPVSLTKNEYNLLLFLLKNAGQVVTREELLDNMGRDTLESFDRSVDVFISRLRKKIEPGQETPRVIRTIRGAGYLLDCPVRWE